MLTKNVKKNIAETVAYVLLLLTAAIVMVAQGKRQDTVKAEFASAEARMASFIPSGDFAAALRECSKNYNEETRSGLRCWDENHDYEFPHKSQLEAAPVQPVLHLQYFRNGENVAYKKVAVDQLQFSKKYSLRTIQELKFQ
jgi:hypothetical protein